MADNITVARPYAQAVFDLAHAAGELAAWSASLEVAGQLLSDDDLVSFLGAPQINDAERLEFLTGLFRDAKAAKLDGSDQQGTNFLKLLLENKRIRVLPEISSHFEVLKAEIENSVDATVTAATALSKAQTDAIAAALKKRLGRDVRITTEIDENLIGGAVIRAGDVVIDGSLRARLEGLANALVK